MLVLNRKEKERILVGDDIEIVILHIRRGLVKVGIEAPDGVKITREELVREPVGAVKPKADAS